jgi:hypothetical protein
VTQDYNIYVNQAHVIRSNDVLFKCDIPSFVTDFVSVQSWDDNEGVTYSAHSQGKLLTQTVKGFRYKYRFKEYWQC